MTEPQLGDTRSKICGYSSAPAPKVRHRLARHRRGSPRGRLTGSAVNVSDPWPSVKSVAALAVAFALKSISSVKSVASFCLSSAPFASPAVTPKKGAHVERLFRAQHNVTPQHL